MYLPVISPQESFRPLSPMTVGHRLSLPLCSSISFCGLFLRFIILLRQGRAWEVDGVEVYTIHSVGEKAEGFNSHYPCPSSGWPKHSQEIPLPYKCRRFISIVGSFFELGESCPRHHILFLRHKHSSSLSAHLGYVQVCHAFFALQV
jgi:hypothetical protein